jgi:hypothetical protein
VTLKTTKGNPCKSKAKRTQRRKRRRRRKRGSIIITIINVKIKVTHDISGQAQTGVAGIAPTHPQPGATRK